MSAAININKVSIGTPFVRNSNSKLNANNDYKYHNIQQLFPDQTGTRSFTTRTSYF